MAQTTDECDSHIVSFLISVIGHLTLSAWKIKLYIPFSTIGNGENTFTEH